MATRTYARALFGAWPPGIKLLAEEIADNGNIAKVMDPRSTVIDDVDSPGLEVLVVEFDAEPTAGEDTELTTVVIPGHVGGSPEIGVVGQFLSENETLPPGSILVHDGNNIIAFQLQSDFLRSDPESQTSSTSFQAKIDTSIPGPDPTFEGGTHRVDWSATVGGTLPSTKGVVRVEVDGNEVGFQAFTSIGGTDAEFSFSGFDDVAISAGTANVKMEFKKAAGGGAVRIRSARIAINRVGL